MNELSLDAICAFGIRPVDEGTHAVDPEVETWNESIFYDWLDHEGAVAGHCRIGLMPNQGRVWFWLFLHQDGEWLAVEEPRLPIAAMRGDGFAYEGHGLSFTREIVDPLRTSRLRVKGFGRIIRGPRAGRIVPFEVALEARAAGAAHSVGDRDVEGHTSETYESNRFEQPIDVHCTQRIGDVERTFDGHGERDHSWGPRYWNMEWWFLVVAGKTRRLQCARVALDEDSSIALGYYQLEGRTTHVEDATFDLRYSDDLDGAFEGTCKLRVEGGPELEGRIETISGVEIDGTHAFLPPQLSVYRRALVRFVPSDGSEPAMGYLEINRFPGGMKHGDE